MAQTGGSGREFALGTAPHGWTPGWTLLYRPTGDGVHMMAIARFRGDRVAKVDDGNYYRIPISDSTLYGSLDEFAEAVGPISADAVMRFLLLEGHTAL